MFLAIPCPVELRLSGANKWERIHRWQFQLCMPKYNLLTKHWLTKNNSFNDLCSTAYLGISKCAISAFHLLVYASLMSFFQVIVCTSTESDVHTRQHPSGDSQSFPWIHTTFLRADLLLNWLCMHSPTKWFRSKCECLGLARQCLSARIQSDCEWLPRYYGNRMKLTSQIASSVTSLLS